MGLVLLPGILFCRLKVYIVIDTFATLCNLNFVRGSKSGHHNVNVCECVGINNYNTNSILVGTLYKLESCASLLIEKMQIWCSCVLK